MTYQQLLALGKQKLREAGVPESDLDARLLLEYVCGVSRSFLLAHGDEEVSAGQGERYLEVLCRRGERVPLQHLTGEQDFMGLTFAVNEKVLIPRQDTEILVEEVLKDLHGGCRILDLCTGSDCILISLLRFSNGCHGVGVDLSEEALEVARENAKALIPEEDCSFLQGDLFAPVEGKFDLLTANPPYIPSETIRDLMPEVRDHEPKMALDGLEDGLHFYRRIIKECPPYLNGGAQVFFEIGHDQGEAVSGLLKEAGFKEVRVVKDYAGLDRVVSGFFNPKDGL